MAFLEGVGHLGSVEAPVDRARAFFERAGGDPKDAGPLAAWAIAAKELGEGKCGVLVAQDGSLIAETVWTREDRPDGSESYWISELLVDLGKEGAKEVGKQRVRDALPALRRRTGQPIVEVRYADVCQGSAH